MESEPKTKNKKLLGIIGLVVIVAAVAFGASAATKKSNTATTAVATATATPSPTAATLDASTTPTATAAAATSAYKDGSYSATGSYDSPGGDETVAVSLTVKDGVVTDSTVTTSGNNPTGKMYQAKFISGYKTYVTGKNLADISLSKVSGSSLTPIGFNDALTKIKTEAKA